MENPYAAPTFDFRQESSGGNVDILRPLYEVKGWMKFLGVLSIINGVLLGLSIWGLVICWVPIMIGMKLNSSASRLEEAIGQSSEYAGETATRDLASAIKILAIFTLVILVLYLLAIIAFIGFFVLVSA